MGLADAIKELLAKLIEWIKRSLCRSDDVTIIKVNNFGGMIPRLNARELPEFAAVDATNVDVRDGTLKPFKVTSAWRVSNGFAGSSGIPQKGIFQPSTAALVARTPAGVSSIYSVKIALPYPSNRTVANGDEIQYCFYFKSAGATMAAEDACCDIEFTDGTTLGSGILDTDGINAITGNLSSKYGRWFQRRIVIGGQLASNGSAINGKTIKYFYIKLTTASAALALAYAIKRAPGSAAQGQILFAPNCGQTIETPTSGVMSSIIPFDEDDNLMFMPVDGSAVSTELGQRYMAAVQVGSDYSNSMMFTRPGTAGGAAPYYGCFSINGLDTANAMAKGVSGDITIAYPAPHHIQYSSPQYPPWNGWAGIYKPTAALAAPSIVGGAGADVTRSYVYTHVSDEGFESAPSPAVTATGKVDGSWNFTNIPLWDGVNYFPFGTGSQTANNESGFMRHKRRVYRTTASGTVYRFLAELDDNDTSLNDTALDAALGEECPTTTYADPPPVTCLSEWKNGVVGAVTNGITVSFCEPSNYHAWPLEYRYKINGVAVGSGAVGDHFVVLTNNKPVAFTGNDLTNLLSFEIRTGEPCVNPASVVKSNDGIIYQGNTGWHRVASGGQIEPVTQAYMTQEQYRSACDFVNTRAEWDGERLVWFQQDTVNGYVLTPSLRERGMVKLQWPSTRSIHSLRYYAPRSNFWVCYTDTTIGSTVVAGMLFDRNGLDTMKYQWKSKVFVLPKPVRMKVAQLRSKDWSVQPLKLQIREKVLAVAYPNTGTSPQWLTATYYNVGDVVTQVGVKYQCLVSHTSGTWATDLAGGYWYSVGLYTVWATATAYTAGQFVSGTGAYSGTLFFCRTNHTSTGADIGTDLAAKKWQVAPNIAWQVNGLADDLGFACADYFCHLMIQANPESTSDVVTVYNDYVVSDRPVRLSRAVKAATWQFTITGNMPISEVMISELERELNAG